MNPLDPAPAPEPSRRPATPEPQPASSESLRRVAVEYLQTIVAAIVLATLIMTFVARAFTVDGPSMLPTLHDGERLLVEKVSYRFGDPQRGDVIVFRYPFDPTQHFIKRVIGIPGDVVEVRQGRVYLNGVALQEDYLLGPTFGYFAPVRVPEGHLFVMGDNRNNSQDSRDLKVGFVPMELVEGRAVLRFWPLSRASLIHRPEGLQSYQAALP